MAEIYRFPIRPQLAVPCLICGEPIPIDEDEESILMSGLEIHSKICGKCRTAILIVRDEIFNEGIFSDDEEDNHNEVLLEEKI